MVIQHGTDERLPLAAAIAASVLLHVWALAMPRWHDRHPVEPPLPLTVELLPQPRPMAPAPQSAAAPEERKPTPKPKPEPPPPPRMKPPPRVVAPAPQEPPPAPAMPAAPAFSAPASPVSPAPAAPPAPADPRPAAEAAERRAATAPASGPVTPPSLNAAYLRNPPPRYPASARRNGEEGTVLLRVAVSADGAAVRVDLERSSGSAALDDAASAAVRNWRFVPARRGGEAVEAVVVVPVVFRLNEGG
jgi:protein TonB